MAVKYVNGVAIPLTAEEIAAVEAQQATEPETPPTTEERLEALEAAMLELLGVEE